MYMRIDNYTCNIGESVTVVIAATKRSGIYILVDSCVLCMINRGVNNPTVLVYSLPLSIYIHIYNNIMCMPYTLLCTPYSILHTLNIVHIVITTTTRLYPGSTMTKTITDNQQVHIQTFIIFLLIKIANSAFIFYVI